MVVLAVHYGEGPLGVDRVSREEGISSNYIRVLLGGLKSTGLVKSVRGARGGYELARDPAEVTAFEVVSALEEEMLPVECVSRSGYCSRKEACATRGVWCEIAASVDEILKNTTLQDLAQKYRETPASERCDT